MEDGLNFYVNIAASVDRLTDTLAQNGIFAQIQAALTGIESGGSPAENLWERMQDTIQLAELALRRVHDPMTATVGDAPSIGWDWEGVGTDPGEKHYLNQGADSHSHISKGVYDLLTDGLAYLNNVPVGQNPGAEYREYASTLLGLTERYGDHRKDIIAVMQGHLAQANSYLTEHSQMIGKVQGYLSLITELRGIVDSTVREIEALDQAAIANNGILESHISEIRARLQESQLLIDAATVKTRVAEAAIQDRRSQMELHGRLEEAEGFYRARVIEGTASSARAIIESDVAAYQTQVESVISRERAVVESSVAGYRASLEAKVSGYRTEVEARSGNYRVTSESAISRYLAEVQAYQASLEAKVSEYRTEIEARSSNYRVTAESTASLYLAEVQAYQANIQRQIDSALRNTERVTQYLDLAEQYRVEGRDRYQQYRADLHDKGVLIRPTTGPARVPPV